MASQMAILYRTRSLLTKSTNITIKSISTFPFLNQEPELAEPVNPIPPNPSSLPPNPASGSPLYNENWRNPIPKPSSSNA
ncbi:pentatricopeptide repeat-containing protein mitochondrial-like, partial [Trifolium medium]|nr:pentatricopeptide repeat-containing protein mitochondrial-like [Trifolium medium]